MCWWPRPHGGGGGSRCHKQTKACCEGQATGVCVGTTVAPHTGGASSAHHNTPCRHIQEQQVAHQMPGVFITSPSPAAAVCGHGQGTPHTTIGFHQQQPLCCALGVGGLPWGSQMKRPPWLASLCQSPLPRAPLQPRGLSVCPCTSQTRTCACHVDAHPVAHCFVCGRLGHIKTVCPVHKAQCVWCVVCGSCAHTRPRCATTHTECHLTWVTAPMHLWQVVLPADQELPLVLCFHMLCACGLVCCQSQNAQHNTKTRVVQDAQNALPTKKHQQQKAAAVVVHPPNGNKAHHVTVVDSKTHLPNRHHQAHTPQQTLPHKHAHVCVLV